MPLLSALALIGLLSTSAGVASLQADATTRRGRMLMGTLCTAEVAGDSSAAALEIGCAFDAIARLEGVMSSWRDDSELSRLNRAAAIPREIDAATAAAAGAQRTAFACSADLYAALDDALRLAALTDGAFDPTVEPLNRAWDMRGAGRVPSSNELDHARALVGWRTVTLDAERRAATLPPGAAIDLGGIGKGIALDRARAVLAGAGIERALINFGGQVQAIGRWQVEVADPRDRQASLVQLSVEDGAISTSGQSERGIAVGVASFGHILDPRTGVPVAHGGSVTVVAASATDADALSTALFVGGREGCARFASRHADVGVLWLEPAGDGVRGWKWNLDAVESHGGVEWMN